MKWSRVFSRIGASASDCRPWHSCSVATAIQSIESARPMHCPLDDCAAISSPGRAAALLVSVYLDGRPQFRCGTIFVITLLVPFSCTLPHALAE